MTPGVRRSATDLAAFPAVRDAAGGHHKSAATMWSPGLSGRLAVTTARAAETSTASRPGDHRVTAPLERSGRATFTTDGMLGTPPGARPGCVCRAGFDLSTERARAVRRDSALRLEGYIEAMRTPGTYVVVLVFLAIVLYVAYRIIRWAPRLFARRRPADSQSDANQKPQTR
jgi:hypothetical protein